MAQFAIQDPAAPGGHHRVGGFDDSVHRAAKGAAFIGHQTIENGEPADFGALAAFDLQVIVAYKDRLPGWGALGNRADLLPDPAPV